MSYRSSATLIANKKLNVQQYLQCEKRFIIEFE